MSVPTGSAVLCLGPSGLSVAKRLVAALPDASLHGYGPRLEEADVVFEDTMTHVATLFAAGVPVVGV